MGKKKGRQSGHFASKSIRAAHYVELYKRAYEQNDFSPCYNSHGQKHHHSSSGYARGFTPPSSSSTTTATSNDTARRRTARGRMTNLSHLRGLLRDRVLEDRARERDFRHRIHQNQAGIFGTVDGIGGDANGLECECQRNNHGGSPAQKRHQVGWILSYNHPAVLHAYHTSNQAKGPSTVTARHDEQHLTNSKPPGSPLTSSPLSLQILSIKAFAPALEQYISSCGREFIHRMIGLLPSSLIHELSILCRNVTNDVAYVLGCHSHLDRLVLNCSPDFLHENEDGSQVVDEDECWEEGRWGCDRLTDQGLKALMPRLVSRKKLADESGGYVFDSKDHNASDSNGDTSDDDESRNKFNNGSLLEECDSWEQMDDILNDQVVMHGCGNLHRLELRDAKTITSKALIQLFQKCPRITHLSLSNSLGLISGTRLLLHHCDAVTYTGCREKGYNDNGYGDDGHDGTLIDLLRNLQVLDLSHCSWMSRDLLITFLTNAGLINSMSSSSSSLQLISVAGCCSDLNEKTCEEINQMMTFGRPFISIKFQKRVDCLS